MAAELHGDTLHVRPGERSKLLADCGRAGEGDLADHRMRDEVGRDFRRHPEHEIDHAGRQPGLDKGIDEGRAGRRRLFRAFEDDRAAGGERGGDLAHRLVDREIPRRERGDRADRLLHLELPDAVAARRDRTTISAPRLFGEPVDDVGTGQCLAFRLHQRLALLHGHQRRDLAGAAAQDVGRLAHQPVALVGRHLAPYREALLRGSER